MAIGVLILGRSGTGKSCSLRSFTNEDSISIINVNGKPLPFKNNLTRIISTDQPASIIKAIQSSKSKVIVIDDSQYIMANMFMRSVNVKGFDKFNAMGTAFWNIIESLKTVAPEKIVYFLHHEETDDNGLVKAKTQGKLLDTHICLEGCFSIVLRTKVDESGYYFSTRNSGVDTVKTPMGMFNEPFIDNDLKLVDEVIRDYYNLSK